ncbi:MAG: polysaccharide biosynthesis/export family protein [Bacteroidota bacterium]|nr:polysaccharide biosynthesis/export family protein [Bacteroidota bacterium]
MNFLKILITLIITSVLFSNCTPYKKIVYLQDKGQVNNTSANTNKPSEYRIQPNDVLYIKIITMESEKFNYFNIDFKGTLLSPEILYYLGSNVNDSGYVDVPVIGKLYVKDKTVEEIKNMLDKSVSIYLKNASVMVKLLSFKITVLGEVVHPGQYRPLVTTLNILEALSIAGDLTPYGDRQKITIIRTNENNKVYKVDITDKNVLQSDKFNLLPNDIIYVSPLRAKTFTVATSTTTTILAAITTLLSTFTTFILLNNYLKK